jgi:hypothetical protein
MGLYYRLLKDYRWIIGGNINMVENLIKKILYLWKNFGKERKMGLGICETTFQNENQVEYNSFLKVS